MKCNKRGFTLIELLVVVLIIGILAAVAVPQYQKAVMKSRNTELKQLVKAVVQAQQFYYLANGKYAANFEDLDINLPFSTQPTQPGEIFHPTCSNAIGGVVPGTDSVRIANNFFIMLNQFPASGYSNINRRMPVVAWHLTGPYACKGGFLQITEEGKIDDLQCAQLKTAGKFCTKIEGATQKKESTDNNADYFYMPQ